MAIEIESKHGLWSIPEPTTRFKSKKLNKELAISEDDLNTHLLHDHLGPYYCAQDGVMYDRELALVLGHDMTIAVRRAAGRIAPFVEEWAHTPEQVKELYNPYNRGMLKAYYASRAAERIAALSSVPSLFMASRHYPLMSSLRIATEIGSLVDAGVADGAVLPDVVREAIESSVLLPVSKTRFSFLRTFGIERLNANDPQDRN